MRLHGCVVLHVLRKLFQSPYYLTSCWETQMFVCAVTMYPILPEIRNGDRRSSAALVDENILYSGLSRQRQSDRCQRINEWNQNNLDREC